MRTLGIDLGSTRTVAASAGVPIPIVLPASDDPAQDLRAACEAARLAPGDVSAVVVVPGVGGDRVDALLDAGRAVGLGAIAAISAPVAVGLAYAARSGLTRAAVYALGARRCEVSVVELGARPRVVAARAAELGGADVDRAIARHVADRIVRACGWELAADREVWARLLVEAERAKVRLAREEVTSIDVAHADPSAPTQLTTIAIDRRALRELAADVVGATLAMCDALRGEAGALDAVLLAGGSALLPGLRDEVGARVGATALAEVDPASAAAIGASLAPGFV